MDYIDFQPGKCYKVFFEKRIPIEFKFLEAEPSGKIKCQKRNGEFFDFNSLEQFLSIKEVYPGW